jgi:NAD(P)-dependent dehydrogenase (short-subunit alcohol dehydrogenase family)
VTFEGTVGIVTGAASGLGAATAELFAARGSFVVVADRDATGAASVAASINRKGGRAAAVACDVTDEESVHGLFRQTFDDHGRLDFAHNNAGVEGPFTSTAATTLTAWDDTLRVNLTGIFLCMREALVVMLEANTPGAIVNTASINSFVAHRNTAAYSASKAGIMGLTRAAALESAAQGIRVNSVCPGWMATPMITERAPLLLGRDVVAGAEDAIPMGRVADPAEVARLVVWLASSENTYVTGQGISVDGGYTSA